MRNRLSVPTPATLDMSVRDAYFWGDCASNRILNLCRSSGGLR